MKAGMMVGAIAIALLQSGCVVHQQILPEVAGRLVDSSGEPVQGAQLTLVSSSEKSAQTHSDGDGRFAFPAAYKWTFFLPIGPGDWYFHSVLHVSVNGKDYETDLGGAFGGPHALEGREFNMTCALPDKPGEVSCQE
ncbi:carboxypeptidase regulatory-like domain-containing protein [Citrobacter farmeri]|uniref:carboxypeptidase regulatory-like domain-containing protein n=1 Tax=Citrobacter farmeri TaxID=67824 RepID=UPI001907F84C|nr:carboxypeptidase-like regulatory domain-containing protein [Citrobacter farmeri]EKV7299179.1 carboxypeptidase regulatory-like domain-containing protein [Citrobacter farmeri]MBJ8747086.1 carboxypeptidase regulatory-like domain-containing protein [Citrobacter farmeri]MBJ8761244.1 carboxypeptidase regulatory-like domain-containing protein [Citrobacter farmeri]MBJ9020783.1 carboxypeptidase regulatory-like domain-containing protein [Citrobacter farmeri]